MRLSRRAKRRWIVLGVLAVTGGCGAVAWRALSAAQEERLVAAARQEGLEAWRQGDLKRALDRLSFYHARRKNDIEAMLGFADVRRQLPEVERRHLFEAAGLYRRVRQMEPDNLEALAKLLDLSVRLGDRSEAAQVADDLLKLEPGNRAALEVRLVSRQASGRFDEARQTAATLIDLEPEQLQWRLRLLQIMHRQRVPADQMLALADRWVAEHDGAASFGVVKARLLFALGREDAAAAEALAAAAAPSTTLPALQALLALLDDLDLHDAAAQAIDRAMETLAGSAWVWQVAAQRHWRSGRNAETLAVLATAEERLGALDPTLLRLRVLAQREVLRFDDAQRSIEGLRAGVQSLEPDARNGWHAWSAAMSAALDGGRPWAERRLLLERALALRPDDAALHTLDAQAWEGLGELDLALAALKHASWIDPAWLAPKARAVSVLLALGRPEEAFDAGVSMQGRAAATPAWAWLLLARAWLEHDPRSSDVGLIDRSSGAPVDLVGLLEALSRHRPAFEGAAPLLAEAYLANGRAADAEAILDAAIVSGDTGTADRLALARLSARHRLGCERRLVEAARGNAGLTLEVAEALAAIERREGRVADGLSVLEDALAAAPAERRAAARRMRASYLLAVDDPGAGAALAALLEPEAGTGVTSASGTDAASGVDAVAMAGFVLGQASAWRDPALVSRAIDRLAAVVGDHAPRVRLARATLLYRAAPRSESQLAEAIVLTEGVLTESPDSLPALALMSALLLEGNVPDPLRAIDHLKHAVSLYPRQIELYPRLIDLHQRRGDFAAAGPLLESLGELAGRDPVLVDTELRLLQAQGDFPRAVLRLSEFVDSTSSSLEQLRLAQLEERAGRLDEATAIYARLLKGGASLEATVAAADFHAGQGRLEEAHRMLEAAALGERSVSVRLRGALLRRYGELDAAAPLLEEAVLLDPANAEAWTELARLRLARADFTGARSAAEAGLVIVPTDASLESIAQVASLDLNDQAARREAIEALGDSGSNPAALRKTLLIYQRAASREDGPSSRDRHDALELARQLRDFLPAWKMAVTWLAADGQVNEAVRMAEDAATLMPARPEPAEWATSLMLEAGRETEALEKARQWRNRMNHRPYGADTLIAALELSQGRPRRACNLLEPYESRIVAERERWPQRTSVLMGAFLHDGQLDRAFRLLCELVVSAGGRGGGEGGWVADWLARSETAPLEYAERALKIADAHARRDGEPGVLRLATAWANVARRSGVPAHTAVAERLASELTPGPAVLALQARLAIDRRDPADAERCYRSALEFDPDDVDVLNNLAWLLVKRGAADEAAGLAARAADLAPDDADVLDTLATALLGSKRFVEAERVARRARSLRSEDPALGLTLTRVLMESEQLGDAEAELARTQMQIATLPPAERRAMDQEAAALRSEIASRRAEKRSERAAVAP